MSPRKKIILDTNLLIDWINEGSREQLFTTQLHQRYLSAVVWMELRAGVKTKRAARAVDRLAAAYGRLGRIIAPPGTAWATAGRVLERLRRGGLEVRRASLVNDVLIAMTARSIGATLLTSDADFRTIHRVERFALDLVTT